MFLPPQIQQLMPVTYQSRNLTPNHSQHLQRDPFASNKPPHFPKAEQKGIAKFRVKDNDNKIQTQQPPQSNSANPKYSRLLQLAEKLADGILQQLHHRGPKGQNSPDIRLSEVSLQTVDELKSIVTDIKQEQTKTDNGRSHSQINQPSHTQSLNRYKDAELRVKRQLSQLLQQALGRRYRSSSVEELLAQVQTVVTEFKKVKAESVRLENENKKIRLYYLQEIQHYKEELKFIHQVIAAKETQIKELEQEIAANKSRPLFQDKEEQFSIEINEPPLTASPKTLRKSGSFVVYNSTCEPKFSSVETDLDKGNNQIEKGKIETQQKGLARQMVSNPESHHKSKSDMVWQELREECHSIDNEMAIYSQLGSVNARMKELNNLLNERLQESEGQLAFRSEQLEAMTEEVCLLEDDLARLNDRIVQKEQEQNQKEARLSWLQQQIIRKQIELTQLEEQVAALANQKTIEEYNLGKMQEQLQFLEEQYQVVSKDIEDLRTQGAGLNH